MANKISFQLDQLQQLIDADFYQQIHSWHQHLAFERNLSPHTIYNYLLDLKLFILFLIQYKGAQPTLEDIINLSLTDIRAFLSARRIDDISKRSNARTLSCLKAFFKFLKTKGFSVNTSIQSIKSPRLPKLLPKAIFPSQAETLVTMVPQQWQDYRDDALFTLLYGCGLRLSEALQLTWRDIPKDYSKSYPLRILGKGSKERLVMILPIVTEKLHSYQNHVPFPILPEKPVFVGARGDKLHPTVAQRSLRLLRQKMGLPDTLTPHTLRHSFATHIMEKGGDIRKIQEILGHSSLSTTQIYTMLNPDKLLTDYQKYHPRDKKDIKKI